MYQPRKRVIPKSTTLQTIYLFSSTCNQLLFLPRILDIPVATKRYTTILTTDLRRSPGAEANPAAKLPAIIAPNTTYPNVMKSNVTTAPTIPFTEITLHLSNLLFILPNIAHAIIGMIVFIISVGTAHTANPVNISAIAEPIPPASAPTTGPKKNAHISVHIPKE